MSKKSFELVKIVTGNSGSGRVTIPKNYLKELEVEPGEYIMSYVRKIKIPKNVAMDVGCKKNLEVKALVYVPVTIKKMI